MILLHQPPPRAGLTGQAIAPSLSYLASGVVTCPLGVCGPCSHHQDPCHLPQELEKLGLGDGVDLHVYEIPVEYKTVQTLIPALWEKHSPQVRGRWCLAPPAPMARDGCGASF